MDNLCGCVGLKKEEKMTVDKLKILLADYVIMLTEAQQDNNRLITTNKQLVAQIEDLKKQKEEDEK